MAKDWRGFASEFAGSSEIRFEDFDGHKGGAADGKGLVGAGFSKTWDGQIIMDEAARQEKLAAMKRKLKDQQDRLKKAHERQQQKDLHMAEAYLQHRQETQAEKDKERQARLEALNESRRRANEVKAQREQQQEAAKAQAAADAKLKEMDDMSVFLTGISQAAAGEGRKSLLAEDNDKPVAAPDPPPEEEKKEKKLRKAGLPVEAMMASRKKQEKEHVGVEKKDKTNIIQQLPQLFPGLRRTAEGKQILDNAEQKESFKEKQPVSKEHLLRNAQVKLMDQLRAQVSEYRKSMKSKMFSPITPNHGFGESLVNSQMDQDAMSPTSQAHSRLSRKSLNSMGLDRFEDMSNLSMSMLSPK